MSLRRSTLAVASATILTATALTACSSSGSGGGAANPAGSSGSAANASGSTTNASGGVAHAKAQIAKFEKTREHYGTPATVSNVPDLKGKTVWYIPLGTSVPVLKTMGTAITQAMGKLGATVHMCDGKFTPTTVAGCMQDAGTHGAAAVITGFVDYKSVPSAYQSLAARGIPTLVAGEAKPAGVTANKNLGFFDTTPLTHTAYQLMADSVIADSNGKATVLQISLTDSPTTVSNTTAANQEFKTYCPACSVTTVSTTTADMSKLGSLISAKLSANPDTKYVLLPQDAFLQAALPGLQSSGFANKVKIVAAGGSTAGLQSTKSKQIAYNIGQGAIQQGWSMADAAVRLMSGAQVTPETDGPVRVFTPENVTALDLTDTNYNSSVWYGGDAWQQDFLTAWGVK
jgi:ABC-type sugar transport system, periplasmic component